MAWTQGLDPPPRRSGETPDRVPAGRALEGLHVKPERFEIHVPDAELADLHDRLARTRWAAGCGPRTGWSAGTDEEFLHDLVTRWRDDFDWRRQETELNSIASWVADLDGTRVHFVHERGHGPRPLPPLLGHSCYSNFYEFHKVIGPLTDPSAFGANPNDSFDVVVWSLPGFGFSERPHEPGWNVDRMASTAHGLMTNTLDYSQYGVAGGSWGGLVGARTAFAFPEAVAGPFLTQAVPPAAPVATPCGSPLSQAEQQFHESLIAHRGEETGYAELLRTRPDSVAYALNDSPGGLAGWITERWRAWSDCGGDLWSAFSLDEVLTSLSLTWFTGAVGSGQRLHYENAHGDWAPRPGDFTDVPTGVLGLPGHPARATPAETTGRTFNLAYHRTAPRGGHFPALEVPEVLVESIRDFYRPLRGDHS